MSCLLFSSCAKPHYIDSAPLNERYSPSESSCPLYFSEERLCLKIRWITFPSESTLGVFIMTFFAEDAPERPISPRLTPDVKLWMPSMGHGSSPVVIKSMSDGIYEVSDIFFIMLGDWEIRYQLKSNDDVIEEQIQKIHL